jgi:hypothetical protein
VTVWVRRVFDTERRATFELVKRVSVSCHYSLSSVEC